MTARYSIDAIKAKISLMEVVAGSVVLKKAGRELVGLCPFHGERTPSFYVNPGKGVYLCYGCGAKGDVIGFYRDIHRLDDKTAIAELAARAGLMPEDEAARIAPRQRFATPMAATYSKQEEERYRAATIDWSRDIWRVSRPAPGSLVERYLIRRGIDPVAIGGLPPSLRFHPDLPSDKAPGAPHYPAMVAAVQNDEGRITGIHRTFLARNGDAKAPLGKQAKKMLGVCWGGATRLAPVDDVLAIGEGIETSLSVLQALRQHGSTVPVWAALSLGNIAGRGEEWRRRRKSEVEHPTRPGVRIPAPWPDLDRPGFLPPATVKRLIILGDGDSDPHITRALINCATLRFQRMGLEVRVAWAEPGKDFNDMIQRDMRVA
jgi:hypothetical protein